jgi:glycosyltransferase involved in cell wall biosynthesis
MLEPMDSFEPLVSICLPTHSRLRGGHLQSAVHSVLSQSYSNFELLIVDDCSTDGSQEFLSNVASSDSRVTNIRLDKRVGLPAYSAARAYTQSRGELIVLVTDDSILRPDNLQNLVSVFAKSADVALAYGMTLLHNTRETSTLGKQVTVDDLREANHLGNSSVMLRKSVIEDVGYYDPHIVLKRACDWDLWLRVFEKYKVEFIPAVLSEEFGPVLSDSLCRSTQMFPDLVRKYMAIDRSQLLHPARIVSGAHCISDFPFALQGVELECVQLLMLEHYLAVADVSKIAQVSKQVLAHGGESARILWKGIASADESEDNVAKLVLFAVKYYEQYGASKRESVDELRRLVELEEEHCELHNRYHSLQRSVSWRLTRPLRDLKAALRKKPIEVTR